MSSSFRPPAPTIAVCPGGCVRLQFGPTFVVLPRKVFKAFAASVADALRAFDDGAIATRQPMADIEMPN